MVFVLGWLLAMVLAAIFLSVFFGIGLFGMRKDQQKPDPLGKESNNWW